MSEENKEKAVVTPTSPALNKNAEAALSLLNEHCPTIMEAMQGSDELLKEAAESILSWNVFSVSGGDLNYAVRALSEMVNPPINKMEMTESRFIESKRFIIKARGDADTEGLTDELLKLYAGNIMAAMNDSEEHHKIKHAAEQSLSQSLLGHKTADFNFIKKHMQDNIEKNKEEIKSCIKNAELEFIDTRGMIKSLLSEFKETEEKGMSSVIQAIQLGIARYNILFVLLLIIALAFSAEYLSQQALPLVAAAIGAASAHLLAERNTVLGGKKNNKSEQDCD